MYMCIYIYICIIPYICTYIYVYKPSSRFPWDIPMNPSPAPGAHLRPHSAAAGEGGLALRAQGLAVSHGGQVRSGRVGAVGGRPGCSRNGDPKVETIGKPSENGDQLPRILRFDRM